MTAGESHDEETGWRPANSGAASTPDRPATTGRPRFGAEPPAPEPIYIHVAYRREPAPIVWAAPGQTGPARRPPT